MKARGKFGRGRKAIKPAAAPRLTPLDYWQKSMDKLTAWRKRVAETPTMQGEDWRRGQLRHIDSLIAAHRDAKPAA